MAPRLRDTKPKDPPTIGHNSAEVEEANRIQLLSVFAKYDAALGELELAQGPVRAARKKLASITGLAKQIGLPKWRLEQRHEEMQRPTHENADNIAAETRERRWLGIITPDQLSMRLDGNTPQEVIDEEDARTEGYKLGVRGKPATIPDTLNPRFHQPFLKGHESGWDDYILTLAENAPKSPGVTAASIVEGVRAQAAADFAEDNKPEGTIADDRFAERRQERAVREALENMPADQFEATSEELAAQALRPSNQDEEEILH